MNKHIEAYLKASKEYFNVLYNITRNPIITDEIKKDFEEKYPEYYINQLFDLNNWITASIYRKSDNKIMDAFAYICSNGEWKFDIRN